ncbi:kinase-like domain-containing protein [Cyathus striatus]|nr:kinase-like domain-containing protein [Cyathus striatus]
MQDLTGQVRKVGDYPFAHGGMANLWKGSWAQGQAEKTVAIKVIRVTWQERDYMNRLKFKLVREGQVWSKANHPNITPLYGISYTCLIAPYYSNQDLCSYIRSNPTVNPVSMLAQAAAGLAHLHALDTGPIVHGDIKASNILVNDTSQPCLTDFGLARILETSGFTTKSVGGTCRWMAYELLAPTEGEDDDNYVPPLTKASDVWAFGMTMLEVLTGQLPFMNVKNDSTVILSIIKGVLPARPAKIDDGMWRLLQHCWNFVPDKRPSMRAAANILELMVSKKLTSSEVDSFIL